MRYYPLEFIDSKWFEDFEIKINNVVLSTEDRLNINLLNEINSLEVKINGLRDVDCLYNKESFNYIQKTIELLNEEIYRINISINSLDNKLDKIEDKLNKTEQNIEDYKKEHNIIHSKTIWNKIIGWFNR